LQRSSADGGPWLLMTRGLGLFVPAANPAENAEEIWAVAAMVGHLGGSLESLLRCARNLQQGAAEDAKLGTKDCVRGQPFSRP